MICLAIKNQSQPNRKVEQPTANNLDTEDENPISDTFDENNDDSTSGLFGRMNEPGQGEWIEWKVAPVFLLVAPEDEYEELSKKAFKQVCSLI